MADDAEDTLITCAACGGDWRKTYESRGQHREAICGWCIRGSMTAKQLARWNARRKRTLSRR